MERRSELDAPAGTPWSAGGIRGLRYGASAPELEEAAPRWLAEGRVVEGEDLKGGRVFRLGEWVVKFYEARRGWKSLRSPLPLQCAQLHAELLPIRTPAPKLALAVPSGAGLLVSEFVEGVHPNFGWGDAELQLSLPLFVAEMHRRGVFHGDLNARNLLWTGEEWVLLDVESLRRGLHLLRRRRLIESQWARLLGPLRQKPGKRECFEAYLEAAGLDWDREKSWQRVEALAWRFVADWDAQRAAREAALQNEK